MSLDEQDKQWLWELETRLLAFMGQRFDAMDKRLEAIEATVARLDKQAEWERIVRDLLRRVDLLERRTG